MLGSSIIINVSQQKLLREKNSYIRHGQHACTHCPALSGTQLTSFVCKIPDALLGEHYSDDSLKLKYTVIHVLIDNQSNRPYKRTVAVVPEERSLIRVLAPDDPPRSPTMLVPSGHAACVPKKFPRKFAAIRISCDQDKRKK